MYVSDLSVWLQTHCYLSISELTNWQFWETCGVTSYIYSSVTNWQFSETCGVTRYGSVTDWQCFDTCGVTNYYDSVTDWQCFDTCGVTNYYDSVTDWQCFDTCGVTNYYDSVTNWHCFDTCGVTNYYDSVTNWQCFDTSGVTNYYGSVTNQQLSNTCGVTNYSSGWRKHVANQGLESDQLVLLVVHTCTIFTRRMRRSRDSRRWLFPSEWRSCPHHPGGKRRAVDRTLKIQLLTNLSFSSQWSAMDTGTCIKVPPAEHPEKCACQDKTFVLTKLCLSWQIFLVTKICLSQQSFCRNKHTFVATKDMFCHDKHMFVTTNTCLSQQTHVRRDNNHTCGSSYQWLIDDRLYSAILRSLEQTHCACMRFCMSD